MSRRSRSRVENVMIPASYVCCCCSCRRFNGRWKSSFGSSTFSLSCGSCAIFLAAFLFTIKCVLQEQAGDVSGSSAANASTREHRPVKKQPFNLGKGIYFIFSKFPLTQDKSNTHPFLAGRVGFCYNMSFVDGAGVARTPRNRTLRLGQTV